MREGEAAYRCNASNFTCQTWYLPYCQDCYPAWITMAKGAEPSLETGLERTWGERTAPPSAPLRIYPVRGKLLPNP